MQFHPIANVFPLLDGDEFDALAADIKANGLREPIWLYEGMILDGRNRYRASAAAGIDCPMRTYDGSDPVAFVVSLNLKRRHLNESQRGMIAARLATLKRGDVAAQRAEILQENTGVGIPTSKMSAGEAAALLNISRDTVLEAKKVLNEGTPEEIAAVESGQIAASTIAKQIRQKVPPETRKKRADQSLSQAGKNPERIENQRIRAQTWASVRDALNALTSLPLPSDVVPIIRAHDKTGLVDAKLARASQWLKEFSDVWNDRDEAAA